MHATELAPRVSPETLLPAVIHEMSEKRLGMTTVVDESGKLLGIISDGDLRRLAGQVGVVRVSATAVADPGLVRELQATVETVAGVDGPVATALTGGDGVPGAPRGGVRVTRGGDAGSAVVPAFRGLAGLALGAVVGVVADMAFRIHGVRRVVGAPFHQRQRGQRHDLVEQRLLGAAERRETAELEHAEQAVLQQQRRRDDLARLRLADAGVDGHVVVGDLVEHDRLALERNLADQALARRVARAQVLALAVAADAFFFNPTNFSSLIPNTITRPVLWNRFNLDLNTATSATDAERITRLLKELEGVDPAARTARFMCAMCLVVPASDIIHERGTLEGRIGFEPRGSHGFGYDPIFLVQQGDRTLAELSADEKNMISHRGVAMKKIRPALLNALVTKA